MIGSYRVTFSTGNFIEIQAFNMEQACIEAQNYAIANKIFVMIVEEI